MTCQLEWKGTSLMREVERLSSTRVSACYQCHKCTTGCPVGQEMDYLPSQVMRLIQLGEEKKLLESRAIWICASCQACTTRCPMGIDIAAVMDTLRMLAVKSNAALPDAKIRKFNSSFLTSVRWHSRVYEMGLMALYKIKSGDLFSDVSKVPKMLAKGKLALLPRFSGVAKEVRRIFKRAEEEEKKR